MFEKMTFLSAEITNGGPSQCFCGLFCVALKLVASLCACFVFLSKCIVLTSTDKLISSLMYSVRLYAFSSCAGISQSVYMS